MASRFYRFRQPDAEYDHFSADVIHMSVVVRFRCVTGFPYVVRRVIFMHLQDRIGLA